jgi:integrase
MPTKLPSGMWRQQVFVGYEDGKRKYRSFTAPTKEGAKLKALEYSSTLPHSNITTVRASIMAYIAIKRPVLSPSTINGYSSALRSIAEYDPVFLERKLYSIDAPVLQTFVNNLYSNGKSAKTVRNIYHLIGAVLRHNGYTVPNVTLPTRERPEMFIPDAETVKKLLTVVKGTKWEVPVLLAALGPMRRGEIVGARIEDLSDDNVLYVHRTVVENNGEKVKDYPKTDRSNRYILLPEYVCDLIRAQGCVSQLSCHTISKNFHVLLKKNGIKHFRFHDLRHAFVSIAHASGVPDAYIMQRGGWSSTYTMTNVYRHVLDDTRKKQDKLVNDTFSKLL